jgi:predicted nucleotidyltransferase
LRLERNLSQTPQIELAVLFGSILKGMERADSDVDIFIVCKGEKSKFEDKLTDMTNISQNKFGNPRWMNLYGFPRQNKAEM